jgi:uncharacterized membrane protein
VFYWKRGVSMRSNVRIGNHPLHPILVLIPVGLWIGSLVFDIVYQATADPFWFQAASWDILFGLIGAGLAAIVGLIDLTTLPMSESARRTGVTHLSLNLVIVALYIISLITRGFGVPASMAVTITPFVINIIAVVLLLISGWLGGEMIYRHGVAVPDAAADEAVRYSHPPTGRPGIAGARGGEASFNDSDHPEREA